MDADAVFTIRPAHPNDADAIITGINTICSEDGAFYITHFILSPPWQQVLYQPEAVPDHLLAVAVDGQQFLGSCRLFPAPAHSLSYHVVELGIFVLPKYRRQGIGRLLLQYGLDWAVDQKFEKVTLGVFASNKAAIRLYTEFGFIKEGCQQRQIKTAEEYVDLIWMARFL